MPFNRHGGSGGGFNRGGNSFGAKRPWDRGSAGTGFDERPKFKATCASCGNVCEVPFKPNGSKPVYCRDCFKKEGNGGETRSFERRTDDRGFNLDEKQMFPATCASCGASCEVPFKPNGRKPIYCRACFGKNEGTDRSDRFERPSAPAPRQNGESAEQFRILNAKLDAILKALAPTAPVKAPEAKVEAKKIAIKTEEAPKAPAKKKAAAKKKK